MHSFEKEQNSVIRLMLEQNHVTQESLFVASWQNFNDSAVMNQWLWQLCHRLRMWQMKPRADEHIHSIKLLL
jgi:hypothetical protein